MKCPPLSRRRFNFETIRPIPNIEDELELVQREVERQLAGLKINIGVERDVTELLVQTFHELRTGKTVEGAAVQQPSSVLSTAEAVSVAVSASLHAKFYGSGKLGPAEIVEHLIGSAIKEPEDRKAVTTYFDVNVKERAASSELWKKYYDSRKGSENRPCVKPSVGEPDRPGAARRSCVDLANYSPSNRDPLVRAGGTSNPCETARND